MEHLVMIMIYMAFFCIGVIIFFPLSVVCLRKYWCKKTQTAKVERQAESSSNVNVFYVNSVYLPTEEIVEIPLETAEISNKSISKLKIDLDLPPSYSELFGSRSTLNTLV